MTRRRRWRVAVLGALIGAPVAPLPPAGPFPLSGAAWARTRTVVRVSAGDHPYFGRVVLDAPALAHTVGREGDRVRITFAEDPVLGALPPAPRNVLTLRAIPGGVELTVPPTARVHDTRMGSRVVIDIDDAPAARPPAAPAKGEAGAPRADAAKFPPAPGAAQGAVPGAVPGAAPGGASGTIPKTPIVVTPTAAPLRADAGPLAQSGKNGHPTPVPPPRASAVPVPPAPASPGTAAVPPAAAALPSPIPAEARPEIQHPSPPAMAAVPATASPPPATVAAAAMPSSAADASPPESRVAEEKPPASSAPAPPTPMPPTPAPPIPAPPIPAPLPAPAPPPAEAAAQLIPLPTPESTQVWPVLRDAPPSGPVALIASRTRPPDGLAGAAILVPFAEPVGAAVFARGADTLVVFDERRPIDLAALRDDPMFGAAVVTISPSATVLRLPTPPGKAVVLTRAAGGNGAGWRVSVVAASPRPVPLTPAAANGVLTFAAEAPGQVVAIADPRSGGTLLVGTQRKPGQGVPVERRTAEFLLPATAQGMVVEPISDAVGLRITQAGFVLSGANGALALSPPSPMAEAMLAAARLTRRYGFPGQATDILARRAHRQAVAAAAAPPLARGPGRRALAESLLGLGLAAEAQTVLRVAARDDPKEAASADAMGLAAIAALLAGRPKEATDLASPRLDGTDEIALWRGLQMAMADEGSPAAASLLATAAPLLFTYPEEMRQRILPLALETMVLGGAVEPAARLLAQREHDPRLAYARALLRQARGENEEALKLYDAVTNSRSALDHARAAVRAAELRLGMGRLDLAAAADALEKRLYAWRGDQRELALRLRIAELRQRTGNWRAVFALLRAARADFPAQAPETERRLREAFAAFPRDPSVDAMPPTELIALLEENAELLADGPEGEPIRARLAEKLMALDLPKRADTVLTKLLRAAPIGPARAGFGATLATLRMREGDADGAMLALSESSGADMQDAVRGRRALITARAEARRGDVRSAVDTLASLQTAEADDTRAAILEQAKDWPGARDALVSLAARVVPEGGALDEAQRAVVLRLAAAAARAGDDATLASLRQRMQSRIGTGRQADLFRLLTAEPVRGTADLGRARAEIGLARAATAEVAPRRSPAKPP